MSSEEVAFKRIPISFRLTEDFLKWLEAYQGKHKLDDRTAALHKLREEFIEQQEQLREIKQSTVPTSAGAASYPLIDVKLPDRTQQSIQANYLREQARQQARTEGALKRKELLKSSRWQPNYFPIVSSHPRSCPKGWTASKCHSFPCDRRSECKRSS